MQAVTDDWRTAPIDEKLRAMLSFLEKVTLTPDEVTSSDAEVLFTSGISRQAMQDALLICACFHIIARMADALDVAIPPAEVFSQAGAYLLIHGYI
ncbi:hypothetical protein KTT_56500 [Tengunoibacter tsumagoiensis]|uniref:Peroxidase n=1 Tax=Tengunoibacter tsumagoiensis TaxID=2014871 RepID=A0A402AA59_9CHLR|nr:hypothetical protein KTT_56500 [Tengunoibacter tsumagoiensis]